MGFFHNPTLSRLTWALLRIVTGLVFMIHGAQKLFGWFGGMGPNGGGVPLASLFGLAGVLEFFGGLLIVLGLFTRPVAFLLAGEMAYAFWTMHFPNGGINPVANHGEPAVLYCFVFLFLAFNGAGPFSIDDSRARPRFVTTG
jgi:putative oxidoreductase